MYTQKTMFLKVKRMIFSIKWNVKTMSAIPLAWWNLSASQRKFCLTKEDVQILDREPHWFDRGAKEAIFDRKDASDLNKEGDLKHELSFLWNKCLN